MKKFRLGLLALALGLVGATSAYAHDSVGFSLNIGIPGYYASPPTYYAPPPVVYYSRPPVVYYEPTPIYYGPRAYFRYDDGPRRWHRDHDRDDHHGWRGHRWHDD